MRQVIHIVRKDEMDKERKHLLELELDYFLATLHDAMDRQDEKEMACVKHRLLEITNELKELSI
ncbi:hypothetical protein CF394_01715 [Tetzosporium hominis]|uniref:Uncharacterized protein n=1 Tax=Tetzosporium hominis TaxID=2020506 RepID=A0A264W6F1_9BACL|nr:hypothetical protein [Tetzosporium hominis]OZS79163.1 hypothetical protein CF394_01715 [Tetzosporium hominis]